MKNQHITIKNFGPIKFIDLNLKRFTFFIGMQGSGKSTVAKVVSYCMWVEKIYSTTFSDELFATKDLFINRLLEFHNLNGYKKDDSEICYETDYISIHYTKEDYKIDMKNKYQYQKTKILYVPAERNLAVMPDFEKANLGNNSIRSFLFDWYESRRKYSRNCSLDVLDLGIRFFSEEINGISQNRLIHENGSASEIMLADASSGLKSIVPLEVVVDYYTSTYYIEKENVDISFIYKENQQKIYTHLLKELILEGENIATENSLKKVSQWINNLISGKSPGKDKFIKAFENLVFTHSTNFVIEEPEQNLYPTTLKAFLAFLTDCCNAEKREHSYLITTHSPFLLNYMILFLKASSIMSNSNKEQKREINKIIPLKTTIREDEVEIYEFKDGKATALPKLFGLPSNDNQLNNLLGETNIQFSELLEIEDLCKE